MYKKISSKWFPILVAVASTVSIVAILIIRGGVSDGVRYITSSEYEVLGCELPSGSATNDLLVENVDRQKISKLMVDKNEESICETAESEVLSFRVGFYKQYLISLVINGETILTTEEGVQAYKSSTTIFIFGIVLFNLICGLLMLISNTIRGSS